MAKKNNNNGVENKNKNNNGGEKKKAIASKIVKWVKSFQGAESVKSEGQANKLTVVGKMDPTKLRDELATKTKNKVDLVSPQPKKDNKLNKDDANDTKKKKPEKTDNDEKPKEAPLELRNLRVLNRIRLRVLNRIRLGVLNWIRLGVFYLFLVTSLIVLTSSGCTSLLGHMPHLKYLEVSKIEVLDVVSTNDGNDWNDSDDGKCLHIYKKNNNGVENKNKNNHTNNNDGGEKKEDGSIASKIVKRVKSFQSAESVKSEGQANKLTVVGKVDPTKLRDELATKTKNKVDLVSSQPKKDNKVNKDDANDTKKKKPEKTDNDEKPKEAPLKSRNLRVLNRRHLRVLNRTNLLLTLTHSRNLTLSEYLSKKAEGYDPVRVALESAEEYISKLKIQTQAMEKLSEMLKKPMKIVPPKEKNGGNDNNDGNDGNDDNDGGGGGDKKKKEEDEGNGGGKMKYPAGQSGFGQFSYGKVYRHGYGYQNGALKTVEEKMLLLCCEVFGLLVIYNHLTKYIYSNVTRIMLLLPHLYIILCGN